MNAGHYTRLFNNILQLYPPDFRDEYGEEMLEVFLETLEGASDKGAFAKTTLFLREIKDLTGGALGLRINGWQPGNRNPAAWEGPPSRQEILIALTIFALPGASILLNLPINISSGWLAALLAGVFIAGLLKGFPRWSLPILGLSLSAFSFTFIFQRLADFIAPSMLAQIGLVPQDESTRLLLHAFWAGLMWFTLFGLTALTLGLLALIGRFRLLIKRVWQDWTLASYILYSGALFTLVLTFGQYRYERAHAFASTLCLATGALLYLLSRRPWQRSLSLIAGLTLAVCVAVAGQVPANLHPDWMTVLGLSSAGSEAWFEIRRAVLEWGWMTIFLLAPGLLRLLPRASTRRPTPS
jgi:hypothetical protein